MTRTRLTVHRAARLLAAAAAITAAAPAAHGAKGGGTWTDPAKAAAEDPDFKVQGEYLGAAGAKKPAGLQVVALGGGQFYLSRFAGGLPGAGWDGSDPATATLGRREVESHLAAGFKKTVRESPTLGAPPPARAVLLTGEEAGGRVTGKVEDGLVWAGAKTVGEFGSFRLHLEFRLPYKPASPVSSQDRGNSGIYLHNRYEVQVLDSFGLVYDREKNGLPARSSPKQWCGCLYKFKTADVPMCLPPLAWQTYDIDFTAARFEDGKKVANARITVRHNGVTIHDDVELPKGTGVGGSRPEVPRGPIIFQGHGNPVAFRNIWVLER